MAHKLLLADDSVTIQRVIELTFADQDVQVLTAGDGEQAIQRVQADRPDIVLADIGMPKRNGYEVAAFVKGNPDFSHIPVLLLTGAFEPVDEGRAQAVGCDGVLVKPFEPHLVIARVRELLQGAARRSTAPAVSDIPRPAERLTTPRALELPPRYERPAAQSASADPAADFDFGGPAPQPRAAHEAALDDYFDRLDAAFANIATRPPEQPQEPEHDVHEPEVMPRHERPVMETELDWFDSPSQQASRAASAEHMSSPPPGVQAERPSLESARDQHEPPADLAARHITPVPSPAPSVEAPAVERPATFASPPAAIEWPVPGVVEGLTGGIRHPEPPPPEPPDQSPTISAEGALSPPPPVPAAPLHRGDRGAPAAASAATGSLADAFSALLAVEQGEPGAVPVRLVAQSAPEVTDELIDAITRRVVERLAPDAVRDLVSSVVTEVAERLVRDEIQRLRSRQ